MIFAAGYADPKMGWGGPLGWLAGVFVVYLLWRADKWWRQRRGEGGDPSPTAVAAPVPRETSQVARVSSQPSHETDPAGGSGETHWGGQIEKVNGSWRRVYRTARHVVKTGESPAVIQPYQPPAGDPEIDIPLADELWDDEGPSLTKETAAEIEADEYDDEGESKHRESKEEYAARCVAEGVETPAIVEALKKHYGTSRATAYRILERVPRRKAA